MIDRRYRYVLSFLCFSAFAAHGVGATLKDRASEASCASDPINVEGGLYKCTTAEGNTRYFNYVDGPVNPPPPPRPPSPVGAAPASRWLSLTNDPKIDIEIDTQRPVGSGVIRNAWLRWSYTEVQDIPGYGKYQTLLILAYYNCKEQTSAAVFNQYYEKPYGSGKQIYSVGKAVQPPVSEYQQTVPGSYGESLMKYVCGIDEGYPAKRVR